MEKIHELFTLSDIMGSKGGWFYNSDFGNLFYQLFRELPSVRMVKFKVDRSVKDEICATFGNEECFDFLEHLYYNRTENEVDTNGDETDDNGNVREYYDFIALCKYRLMFGFFDNECFIAYSRQTAAADIQSLLDICARYRKQKEPLGNMFIVTYQYNDFDLETTNIREVNVDLARHYNDDFLPVAETIDRFIEGERSGLVILHGRQGTGKTTYIRHLIHSSRRKMIYMGGDLVDKLSDPSFIPFIQKQKNSIIIVEDCEELLASRNSGGRTNSGLVNILNISDGLLGDSLCIKFICTFNAPLKDIDQALLRKGRLVARYEFRELSPEKANRLIEAEHLDVPRQDHPMTLADIYNYHDSDYTLEKRKVGFSSE